jgi:hypothetical protein
MITLQIKTTSGVDVWTSQGPMRAGIVCYSSDDVEGWQEENRTAV